MVKSVLAMAVKNGYKAYEVEGHDGFGFIVTPNDNVLVVNRGTFGGVTISFAYVPSKETGSGCHCGSDDAIFDINSIDLAYLETDGKAFAKELKAKFYESSKEWYEKCYWNGRGLKAYFG